MVRREDSPVRRSKRDRTLKPPRRFEDYVTESMITSTQKTDTDDTVNCSNIINDTVLTDTAIVMHCQDISQLSDSSSVILGDTVLLSQKAKEDTYVGYDEKHIPTQTVSSSNHEQVGVSVNTPASWFTKLTTPIRLLSQTLLGSSSSDDGSIILVDDFTGPGSNDSKNVIIHPPISTASPSILMVSKSPEGPHLQQGTESKVMIESVDSDTREETVHTRDTLGNESIITGRRDEITTPIIKRTSLSKLLRRRQRKRQCKSVNKPVHVPNTQLSPQTTTPTSKQKSLSKSQMGSLDSMLATQDSGSIGLDSQTPDGPATITPLSRKPMTTIPTPEVNTPNLAHMLATPHIPKMAVESQGEWSHTQSLPSISQVMDNLPATDISQKVTALERRLMDTLREIGNVKAQLGKKELECSTMAEKLVAAEKVNSHKTNTDLKQSRETILKLERNLQEVTEENEKLKNKMVVHNMHNAKQYCSMGTNTDEVEYVRGYWNPNSAFYPCKIKDKSGVVHKSGEHLYQYLRLTEHNKHSDADKVRNAKNAAKAKALAEMALPVSTEAWIQNEQQVMEGICLQKVQQCEVARKALLNTVGKRIVHNMETDSKWGNGPNGKGEDKFGLALENVKNKVICDPTLVPAQQETSPLTTTDQNNSSISPKELIVISDSMLSDTDQYFHEDDKHRVVVFTYRGKTASEIADQIDTVMKDKKPTAVAIHCGTNSLERESFSDIEKAFQRIINNTVWHTGAHIILSGVIYRLDKSSLNGRVDTINAYLQSLESQEITFVDHNRTFKNLHRVLDNKGLHLKPGGKKQVAENIWLALNAAENNTRPRYTWPNPPVHQQKVTSHTQKQDQQCKPSGISTHTAWPKPPGHQQTRKTGPPTVTTRGQQRKEGAPNQQTWHPYDDVQIWGTGRPKAQNAGPRSGQQHHQSGAQAYEYNSTITQQQRPRPHLQNTPPPLPAQQTDAWKQNNHINHTNTQLPLPGSPTPVMSDQSSTGNIHSTITLTTQQLADIVLRGQNTYQGYTMPTSQSPRLYQSDSHPQAAVSLPTSPSAPQEYHPSQHPHYPNCPSPPDPYDTSQQYPQWMLVTSRNGMICPWGTY